MHIDIDYVFGAFEINSKQKWLMSSSKINKICYQKRKKTTNK